MATCEPGCTNAVFVSNLVGVIFGAEADRYKEIYDGIRNSHQHGRVLLLPLRCPTTPSRMES